MKSTLFALSSLLAGSLAAPVAKDEYPTGLEYQTAYSYSLGMPTKPTYAAPALPTHSHYSAGNWLPHPTVTPNKAPTLPSHSYSGPSFPSHSYEAPSLPSHSYEAPSLPSHSYETPRLQTHSCA